MITALKWTFVVLALLCIAIGAPFISFGEGYDTVSTDAAAMFGIDKSEYEFHLQDGKVLNASTGEYVNGTISESLDEESPKYVIRIQKSFSRPWTIANIFHEFAHAAQKKYGLKDPELNPEKHAELLAFNVLWRSKYWFNAWHMIYMHSFFAKPPEYRIPGKLIYTALTGENTAHFDAFA